MPRILVIFAHPYVRKSRANRLILTELQKKAEVTISDLYGKYPYFHIDIKREQQLLLEHDVIVFQHPFYWYSMPPLLKLWFDEVLEVGFAYGPQGEALKGKEFVLSITAGGNHESYSPGGFHGHGIEDFFPPYRAIARLCQMKWNQPIILHNAMRAEEKEILQHAEKVTQKLKELSHAGF